LAATGLATVLTTTELMTNGLTNCPAGGDPALQSHFYPADAVEPTLDAAAATAATGPDLRKNVNPNANPNISPSADSWRVEVAARLERYRTRRKPRSPRYPSLLLPFDAPESWSRPAPPSASAAVAARVAQSFAQEFALHTNFPTIEGPAPAEAPSFGEPRLAESRQASQQTLQSTPQPAPEPACELIPYPYPEPAPEPSAKVIEFPRSAAIPVFRRSELADPVFDHNRPRIVEAPEVLPPPPALGGMLIEPAPQETPDKRADAPAAVPSASIAQRATSALVDSVILTAALAAFAAIFLRLNPSLIRSLIPGLNRSLIPSLIHSLISVRGPLPILAAALGGVAVLLWAAYEFLFVVYTGSTPGLRIAHLRLAAFDGSPLHRRSRRWRVLASFLSAFSAGLGYLWCLLDQDALCWHDRITRSHVQSATQREENPREDSF
jgi:uncharacterized RDD family membrane protein YckC